MKVGPSGDEEQQDASACVDMIDTKIENCSQRRKEAFWMILAGETCFDGSRAIVDDHWLVNEDVLGGMHEVSKM